MYWKCKKTTFPDIPKLISMHLTHCLKDINEFIKMINCIHNADVQRYICRHGFLLPKVEKFTVENNKKFSWKNLEYILFLVLLSWQPPRKNIQSIKRKVSSFLLFLCFTWSGYVHWPKWIRIQSLPDPEPANWIINNIDLPTQSARVSSFWQGRKEKLSLRICVVLRQAKGCSSEIKPTFTLNFLLDPLSYYERNYFMGRILCQKCSQKQIFSQNLPY